jgi:WXXGXW repeat (2 copies)
MLIRSLLITGGLLFLSTASFAQVDASIPDAPPELPTYEQPMAPGDGYIWTPGYWAWDGGYYWVPGTWVMAPEPGYLWTPGYWGWGGNGYLFNAGYWGLSVGFYGGVNYGYGYFGRGYEGGRWESGHFFYNTSVNRVDANSMHNVYNTRLNEPSSRVSFNGGNGGVNARASSEEEAAARGKRAGPVAAQTQHAYSARSNPQQQLSANHGAPPVTATARPNVAAHPSELPPAKASVPNTGNPKLDQKYQKEQNQVVAQQNQQRQKLQQTQDREHQQLTKQNAPPARMQQAEQQHVQQTQQMAQQHSQQMQQVQQRQAPPASGGRSGGGRKN